MSTRAIPTNPGQSRPIPSSISFSPEYHFLPSQLRWVNDHASLKLIQKSRQVGITYADAYCSVCKVAPAGSRFDLWVSSRDEAQARLYLEDCRFRADLLHHVVRDPGQVVLDLGQMSFLRRVPHQRIGPGRGEPTQENPAVYYEHQTDPFRPSRASPRARKRN